MADTSSDAAPRAIKIAVFAMGGEGGGVLADWIVDLAEHNDYIAQCTSVPGVAQRSGATIYYLELFPAKAARAANATPVLGLMPAQHDIDIVLASELMEAGRAVQRGFVTPNRTLLISSSHRVYSMTEKMAMNDGRVNRDELLEGCRAAAQNFIAFDMEAIAEATQSRASAVMLGALAGSQALPFAGAAYEAAIARSKIAVAASIKAFRAGAEAVNAPPRAAVPVVAAPHAPRELDEFPPAVADIAGAGIDRLRGYQNESYVELYTSRLRPFVAFEQRRDQTNYELLTEVARYLALSMAYEDIIRVAEIKIHPSRFARVKEEMRLGDGQILELAEYFHPRLQEITEILPPFVERMLHKSGWLRRFLERMTSSGRIVKTTSIGGFLLLYGLASLKPMRPKSLRFKRQNADLEIWLAEVLRAAGGNYRLAVELAKARNAVRGYGATYERGQERFMMMMQVASTLMTNPGGHQALRTLREAAHADESGEAFVRALADLRIG